MGFSKTFEIRRLDDGDLFPSQKVIDKAIFESFIGHELWNVPNFETLKAYFSMKPAKKIFSLLGGKLKFELALQPSTASTAKIQILFSRQGV